MKNEVGVGVLVLVSIFALAYFIIRIEDIGTFEAQATYPIRVRFDNIAGLGNDSPVLLAGVRVGRVDGIGLTSDGQALVRILLRRDVQLYEGASASVASLGVMGDKYLELTPGSSGSPTVPENGFISGGDPISIDRMVTVMSGIAEGLRATTDRLSNVLGTEAGEATMRGILQNVDAFTEQLGSFMNENDESLRTSVGGLSNSVANLEGLSVELGDSLPAAITELRNVLDGLSEVLSDNRANLGSGTSNFFDLTERLDRAATQFEDVISKINRGEGTLSRLINEPETVEKMHEAAESVSDALAAADTFFNRVGRTQFSFSLRSEVYEQLESTKNYFGLRLELGPETSDRALILHLVDDNIGGLTATNITSQLFNQQGDLVDTVLERRVVRQEGFQFSAQLAQRLGNWQVRGGLLESEAGVGVDYFLGNNRLRLSFEAWDLGRDPDPHLKLRGRYRFYDRFFLTAGWDDLLRDNLRQVFIGGGYDFQ